LPDEKAESAVSFLKAAVAYYKSLGVTVYPRHDRQWQLLQAFHFRDACQEIGLKHKRTKPYTPKTNARPNASSRPRSGSGLMRKPTPHQTAAPRNSPTGFIDTTGIGAWRDKISNANQPLGLTEDNLLRLHS